MSQRISLVEASQYYSYDGETLSQALPDGSGLVGSFIPTDLLVAYRLTLPYGIDDESIDTSVETALLKDGILDTSKIYKISYAKRESSDKSTWLVEAFAVEESKIFDEFLPMLEHTKYIDIVAIAYFVYEGLYVSERIELVSSEVFLHLSKENSFFVIYLDGKYLAHRLLPSLSSLARKLNIDIDVLIDMLHSKGLNKGLYEDELEQYEIIHESFSVFFKRLGATLRQQKSFLDASSIQRISLDFEGMSIPGLWDMLDEHDLVKSKKSILNPYKTNNSENIHRRICAEYLLSIEQEKIENAPNLTLFEAQKPFYKTYSAMLFASMFAVMIFLAGWWYVQELNAEAIEAKRMVLQKEYDGLDIIKKSYRSKITKAEKLLNQRIEAIKEPKLYIENFKKAVDGIYEVQYAAIARRKMLEDVNKIMKHYALHADTFEQSEGKKISILVRSNYNDRERIAQFMNDIKLAGYPRVFTRLIERDESSYSSLVEIEDE